MALIKVGSLITDIRGKLGGVCFQNSSSGLMVRTNTKGKNRNSNSQNLTRNILANTQTAWLGLTEANKEKYNKLSRLSQVKQKNISKRGISGQQLFVKVNTLLTRYRIPTINSTRLNKSEIVPISLTITNNGGHLQLDTNRNLVYNKEVLVLYISSKVNESINRSRNRLRLIMFTQSSTNNFDITTACLDVFGVIPDTDDFIFVKYFICGKRCALLGEEVKSRIQIL